MVESDPFIRNFGYIGLYIAVRFSSFYLEPLVLWVAIISRSMKMESIKDVTLEKGKLRRVSAIP